MKTKQPKARNRATPRPKKTAYTALRQIVQWIPEGLPDRIAREEKADIRTFSCTSHVLLADRAYVDLAFLFGLTRRSVFFVLRRITAVVEVDGKDMEMTFITDNFVWSPRTVGELYRARWAIEIFFKELKQTLQLADFVGYNEKAVKWQV